MSHNRTDNKSNSPTSASPATKHRSDCSPPLLMVLLTDPLGRQRQIPLSKVVDLILGRGEQDSGEGVLIEDPHLATEHARLKSSSKDHYVNPEPTHNGVYVRLFGSHKLSDGDELIMGGCHLRVVADSSGVDREQ